MSPFGIVDVGHLPRAHHGLFEPPIVWTLLGRFGIFGRWFVVVVDFDSLAPEILKVFSQLANVRNNIRSSSPKRINFTGHSSSQSLLSTRTGTAIELTRKRNFGGNVHGEVNLHDVELTAIVDLGDAHDITPLALSFDKPLALANDKHIHQLALVAIRPFCPNFITRVKKSCLGGAECADVGGESSCDHGEK
jgi:hypothetical protein